MVHKAQNLVALKEHWICLWHRVPRHLRGEGVGRSDKPASDCIVVEVGEEIVHQFEDDVEHYTAVKGDE